MKLSKILSGFLGLFLLVFLTAGASAITTPYGEWSNQGNALTIYNGANADYNFYFSSTAPEMTLKIELYSSSGSLISTPLSTSTTNHYYFNDAPYSLTPSDYSGAGDYTLKFSSSDQSGPQSSWSIALSVLPVGNHAPVITSTPVTSVNEGIAYSYDVDATDPDGDAITYSFLANPTWLSINSATGLITGTAPLVSSNTSYTVTVQAEDNAAGNVHAFVTQSFTITVYDTTVNSAPVITILGANPATAEAMITYVDAGATATDAEDGNLTASITAVNSVNTSLKGNYTVVYSVTDSGGNTATATRNISVVDTTAPVITLNGSNPVTITQGGNYTEPGATSIDSYDGSLSVIITGNVNTSVIGNYTITYTSTDSSGNIRTVTRTVRVVAPGDSGGSGSPSGDVVYSSTDVSQSEGDFLDEITSPPINLGGRNEPSTALWTIFLTLAVILILTTGIGIIVLIKKKKVLG